MRRGALVLWLLCRTFLHAGSQEPAPVQLEDLPFDQFLKIVAFELQAEDARTTGDRIHFNDFQDIAELDCVSRWVYLMNETMTLSRQIQAYQGNVLGLSGMFQHLLQRVPQENTWIWLLTNSHRHTLECIHSYWSKVIALALDQHQCLIPHVRDVVLEGIVAWKKLCADLQALQWDGFAFGAYTGSKLLDGKGGGEPSASSLDPSFFNGTLPKSLATGNMWTASVRDWFDGYTRKLAGVMASLDTLTSKQQEDGAIRLHHQDEHGSFVTYEFLRRKVFGQWAIDKGLLRGLLRHVWQPPHGSSAPVSVADFGAGGGHYSTWLNETGLVMAYAFDGTHQAAELTDGAVQEVNLVEDMRLWRRFSWVMCLEVGEHIPQQFASGLLRNLKEHAQEGIVMSWSDDWEGIGHVNCLSRDEFVAKVQDETGFLYDADATQAVKVSCDIEYIARTIAVFRAPK